MSVLLAIAALAAAPAFEDLDRLDASIVTVLATNGGGQALPVDRRLRLRRCPAPAHVEPANDGTLSVRCEALGWRIRVPVQGTALADTGRPVIRRGDVVELLVGGAGFNVVTSAIAMEDGRAGGAVRVKPSTGPAVVTAQIVRAGVVSIGD